MSQYTPCVVIGCEGDVEYPDDHDLCVDDIGNHYSCQVCGKTYHLCAEGKTRMAEFYLDTY